MHGVSYFTCNFINIIVSIYRMKWGVDEFIFAISSDSEFYRLMQWLICMITHSPVYSWKCRNVFKIPKEFVLYSAWMLTLKWLATVGGPLLALSPFVAELSWAAIFFLDSCGNDCMQKDAMIENRRSTSSKPFTMSTTAYSHFCSCWASWRLSCWRKKRETRPFVTSSAVHWGPQSQSGSSWLQIPLGSWGCHWLQSVYFMYKSGYIHN